MSWQKFSLRLPESLVDPISDWLETAGAVAVTLESASDEELFEPPLGTTPLWGKTQVSALFNESVDMAQMIEQLRAQLPTDLRLGWLESLSNTVTIVADQDWQKACQAHFKSRLFSDRLWVYPSWDPAPLDNKPRLALDPGLAFGTGNHATTALCLEWLASHPLADKIVIDYGCGSGILGIAASILGAKSVFAVDNDPQALEATLDNARRNHLTPDQLHLFEPHTLPLLQADLVVANILANPLISLAPTLTKLLTVGGRLVLSGLLIEQTTAVMEAYSPQLVFDRLLEREGWALCVAKKLW